MKNVYIKPIASLIQIRMKENIADSQTFVTDGYIFSNPGENSGCMEKAKGIDSYYEGNPNSLGWATYWWSLASKKIISYDTYGTYMNVCAV